MIRKLTLPIQLCLLLCLTPALSGCQPASEIARRQTAETVSPSEDNFSREITLSDGIQLHYNAEVTVPDHTPTGGTLVTADYSDELVQTVYRALCGDAQAYQYAETARQLSDYVAYGEASLALLKDTLSEEDLRREQAELDSIREAARTAPAEKLPADIAKINEYEMGLVSVDMGGTEDAQFQVFASRPYLIYYSNYQLPVVSDAPCREPLNMSRADAIALAESVLQAIGVADDFSLARACEEPVDYAFYQIYFDDGTKNKAHVLLYLRCVDGVTQLGDGSVLLGAEDSCSLDSLQEYILLKIDDNGILSFEWNTPSEFQAVDDSTGVIDFEDAVSAATRRMETGFTQKAFGSVSADDIGIYIDRIALRSVFSDKTDDMVSIFPAWEFYGHITDESKAEGTDRYYEVRSGRWLDSYDDSNPLCIIHATTGQPVGLNG